jgi:uncharacterized protein (TIRG00374 family)
VLGIAFLTWSLYDLNLTQVGIIIRRLRYFWLALALPVVVGVMWIRSARWRILLDPMKAIGARRMFSIYTVGQLANLLFPALTGQAVRVLILNRTEGVTKSGAVSTMMLETVLDGLSLILFMMGASAMLVLPDWLQHGERWAAIAVLSVFALFVFAVQFRYEIAAAVERLETRLPEPAYRRVHRVWTNFAEGLSALRSVKHLTLAFFCSVISWVGNLSVIALLLYAFDFTLPPGAALVLMIGNTLLLLIPITPANVGTYQVACVLGLSLFGIPKTDAVSFGLVLQATTFLPIATLGAILYVRQFWGLKSELADKGA